MSDRDLLNWAANAAGIELNGAAMATMYMGAEGWVFWNPLEDDGDALRLAAKLHLCLLWPERNGRAYSVGAGLAGAERIPTFVPLDGDDGGATRRAITLAAAEIGKAMP